MTATISGEELLKLWCEGNNFKDIQKQYNLTDDQIRSLMKESSYFTIEHPDTADEIIEKAFREIPIKPVRGEKEL